MTNEEITISEGAKNRRNRILIAGIAAVASMVGTAYGVFRMWSGSQRQPSAAAEVQITGRVANAQTDEPIRKAAVSLEAAGIPARTESDSNGIFSALVAADYATLRIRVVAPGYKPFDQLLPRDPARQLIPVNLEPALRSARQPNGGQGRVSSPSPAPPPPPPSLASMLNGTLPTVSSGAGPWAVIVFGDQDRRDDVTSSVRSALMQSGRDTVSLFRKVSDEQRLAGDIFRGNSDLLRDLQAGRYCSRILAGKLSIVRLGQTEGITFARATLSVHVVSPTGEILRTFELAEKGGGEDDSSARRRAVDELIDSMPRELPAKVD